jgi:hypothetical protein
MVLCGFVHITNSTICNFPPKCQLQSGNTKELQRANMATITKQKTSSLDKPLSKGKAEVIK